MDYKSLRKSNLILLSSVRIYAAPCKPVLNIEPGYAFPTYGL